MRKTLLAAMVAVSAMLSGPALTAELDVPVMMWADGDLDVCSVGAVRGLDPNGDNFLAVRSGPGSGHRMLDKIHTDDRVWIFDENNGWFGIVYGSNNVNCSPIRSNRPYSGPGKTGWVFGKYVKAVAG